MNQKKSCVELLAPVGNLEMLYAAVEAGASAVYLAYNDFGARKSCENFTLDALNDAIIYAHLHMVKVYLTVNTIIYQSEFDKLKDFLTTIQDYNVDALIVQDLGVLKFIKTHFKDFIIHASTQMNVRTKNAYLILHKMGVSRIILGRELSLDVIKELTTFGKSINMETEVFVHGAMCFSCSGNCYFSYSIGGRSGNRGECAQVCRKNFSLYEESDNCLKELETNKALLSMKDLMTINNLKEIIASGVDSLKIEGRLKSPEYVYTVTSLYKKAIEAYENGESYNISLSDLEKIKVTFNRTFTTGYFLNEPNSTLVTKDFVNHQGVTIGSVIKQSPNEILIKVNKPVNLQDGLRVVSLGESIGLKVTSLDYVKDPKEKEAILKFKIKNHVKVGSTVVKTFDSKLAEDVKRLSHVENIKFPVDAYLTLMTGMAPELVMQSSQIGEVKVTGEEVLEYSDNFIGNIRLEEQLSKLNNTTFKLNKCVIKTDSSCFVRISVINDLRRKAVEKLQALLLEKKNGKPLEYVYYYDENHVDDNKISGFVFIVQNEHQKKLLESRGLTQIYMLGESISKRFETLDNTSNFPLIHNLDQINSRAMIVSAYANVTNNYAIDAYVDLGIHNVILSNELLFNEIKNLNLKYSLANCGLQVFGRYYVMSSLHCAIASSKGVPNKNCGFCKINNYFLKDDHDKKYPLVLEKESGCIMNILSAKHINYLHEIDRLKEYGLKFFVLNFTDEEDDDIFNIIDSLKIK